MFLLLDIGYGLGEIRSADSTIGNVHYIRYDTVRYRTYSSATYGRTWSSIHRTIRTYAWRLGAATSPLAVRCLQLRRKLDFAASRSLVLSLLGEPQDPSFQMPELIRADHTF